MPLSFDYQAFEKLSFGLVLQHDVTELLRRSLPELRPLVRLARGPLDHQRLEKDFAGLTAKGQLTESGKLNGVIRAGFNRYNYDNTEAQTDPSYSISLSHVLTERLSHSLTLGRDINGRHDQRPHGEHLLQLRRQPTPPPKTWTSTSPSSKSDVEVERQFARDHDRHDDLRPGRQLQV